MADGNFEKINSFGRRIQHVPGQIVNYYRFLMRCTACTKLLTWRRAGRLVLEF